MASNDLFEVDDNTLYDISLSISTLKYCLFISNISLSITNSDSPYFMIRLKIQMILFNYFFPVEVFNLVVFSSAM